jgi:hypothetical protein
MNLTIRRELQSCSSLKAHNPGPTTPSDSATYTLSSDSDWSDLEVRKGGKEELVFPTSSERAAEKLFPLARKCRSGDEGASLFTPLSEAEEKEARLLSEKIANLLQVLEENLSGVDISEEFIKPKCILMSAGVPQNSPLLRRRRFNSSQLAVLTQYSNLKS